MTSVSPPITRPERTAPRKARTSLWGRAFDQFRRDRAALTGFWVVTGFFLIAIGVWFGWWGTAWSEATGGRWEGPSTTHWLGTNLLGQDIFSDADICPFTVLLLPDRSLCSPPRGPLHRHAPACSPRTWLWLWSVGR